LFLTGKMIENNSNNQKQTEFMQQHSLTKQDLRKLIAEKLERARVYSNVKTKREALEENR